MKEVTSAYDDLEKRMAVFLGLGALMFTSLYLFTQGADLLTHLIRGSLAMVLATLAGWGYGHYLRLLVKRNTEEEQLPDNVERQTREVKPMNSRVITHSEIPDTVIPASEAPRAVDFTLPSFEPAPLTAPSMSGAAAAGGQEEDLPPPPVPPGV